MFQGKAVCMEGLPAESCEFRPGRHRELARFGLEAGAVSGVAEQGVAEVTQVHPDLMRAAGLKFEFKGRSHGLAVTSREDLQPPPMRDRLAAADANGHL